MVSKSAVCGKIHFAKQPLGLFVAIAPLLLCGCGLRANGLNSEGTRYFQQGQHAAAIRRFEQAVATAPRNPDSYYNLGATFHQLAKTTGDSSNWSQAENYYNWCLDLNPDHQECYRGLAVLLAEQNRQPEASRLLQGWKDRNPFSPEPRVELARLYDEMGDKAKSEELLLEAIAIDTTHPRARAALGKLREEQNDFQQAIANYQIALNRNYAQPQLQARVAALTSSLGAVPAVPATGSTRFASGTSSTIRY